MSVICIFLTFYQYLQTSWRHFSVGYVEWPWSAVISVLISAHVSSVNTVSRWDRTLCELLTLSVQPGMTGACQRRCRVSWYISLPLKYTEVIKITANVLKFRTLFSNKMLVFRTEIHKLLVSIANSEDPDQTASSEAVWSGSVLFV